MRALRARAEHARRLLPDGSGAPVRRVHYLRGSSASWRCCLMRQEPFGQRVAIKENLLAALYARWADPFSLPAAKRARADAQQPGSLGFRHETWVLNGVQHSGTLPLKAGAIRLRA